MLQYRWSRWRLFYCGAFIGLLCMASFLFVMSSARAAGRDYYVAVNGSDSNPGTLNQPFQTIQKCATVAVGGDTCHIHGGTYHETVVPTHSGSVNAPITFRSFNHEAVTIDGADPVSGGWSLYQGNIYQTTVQTNPALFANQVFMDGAMVNEANWPVSGSDPLHPARALAEAGSSVPTLYDPHLTQPDNFWVGATVHIWGQTDWAEQTGTVTASTAGKLTISGANHGCPYVCLSEGDQYNLTGTLNALTAPGQWYYDSSTQKLYLWTPKGDSPANHVVEMKQRNYAFDLSGKSSIQLRGLRLFANTITTDQNSTNNVIDSIFARYISHFTVVDDPDNSYFGFLQSHVNDTGIILNGTNNTLSHSDIGISAGNGVALRGSGNSVTDNLIHDVDYTTTYAAGINAQGDHQTMTHNTIYRTGRDGISAGGSTFQNNRIAYNDIFNNDVLTRDAGAIYICCGTDSTGSSIDHNYIHDTQVNVFERFDFNAAGIYLDNGTSNMLIHHNVLWNNANDDIFLHADAANSNNNLVYNNTLGGPSTSLDCCVSGTSGNQVINNIFRGGAPASVPGGTLSNNLPSSTDPLFVNESNFDYHLQAGSPAIDAGKVIPGITDGSTGSAPDIGAYEYGAPDWTAGSSLSHDGTLPAPFVSGVSSVAGTIQLQWNAVKGATGYKVYYGTNSGVYQHTFDAGNSTSAALPNLIPGQNYFMAVTAYNANAESHASTEVHHYSPGGIYHIGQVIYANAYDQRTANTSDQSIAVFAGAAGQPDYLEFDHIDFGSGANAFTLDVASDSHFANQPLEIHLDSPTGTLIGTLKAQGTGSDYYLSWRNFTPQETLITPTTGLHKVFLVSKAVGGMTVGFIHSFSFNSIVTHDAFSQINALSFDAKNGNEAPSCNGTCLGYLDGGTWIEYANVIFGDTGAGQFTADVAVPPQSAGRTIELHIDSPTGTLIGVLSLQSTGDFSTFAPQSTYISKVTGLHNLYLVVTGTSPGAANINWLTFGPSVPALDRTGWTATASSSGGGSPPSNALDGDVATRWTSGAVQSSDMFFQVDMQSPQTFSQIILDANQSPNDFPRGYAVYVSNDGTTWGTAIASGVGTAATVITFPQQTARYIKVVQTASGVTGQWWSIHEFLVFK